MTTRLASSLIVFAVLALLVQTGTARADEEPAAPAAPAAPARPEQPEAHAEPRAFGEPGTVVLDDVLGFGFGTPATPLASGAIGLGLNGWIAYADTSYALDGHSGRAQTVAFAPSVDLFVSGGLSIGARASLFHSTFRAAGEAAPSASVTGGRLSPRLGWAIPFGPTFAVWPRVDASVGASRSSEPTGATTQSKSTVVSWGVGGELLFVATVAKPVTLTFGPDISYAKDDVADGDAPLVASTRTVALGARGGVSFVF